MKYFEENLPQWHFATNHTLTALGLNPSLCSEKLAKS
jgi:hypothetical protein